MNPKIEWKPIDEAEVAELKKLYGPETKPWIFGKYKSEPGGVRMPKQFAERGFQRMLDFKVRSDDVWIVSMPKTGTTMTQEIMWQIMHDVDTSSEALKDGLLRIPFVEFCDLHPTQDPDAPLRRKDTYTFCDGLDSPRFLKTHLPFDLLPANLLDTAKVVYVCRHPIDAAVSLFHHAKMGDPYDLSEDKLDAFLKLFTKGYFYYGDYFHHLKSAWAQRNHPNITFLWYEDIRADMPTAIKAIAAHLNRDISNEKVTELEQFMQIDNYRKKNVDAAETEEGKQFRSQFIRSGTIGNWKTNDRPIWREMFQWMKENLEGTDIPLEY